ncbi:heparan-alpha-glucosaminide N-acetyltransferase domain-containing protein [Dietzia sp. PP-33]|uniref:heparan-alpha-glucosaminide N-acetyltransferase domain-containing protein n=1 Tax=Dietzia sp. PP-33 TaxID=2957500 RepID=UPI0029B94667|nr:heparan-alpha-glucosaminide N-acetyltransferase domain-containing protein [Dietzia sp. PP-33]MDX2357757.1 heparan-alpha-glucosaminide N-acetyltransferase domain-containing protein [Dietzia sp. PP-33]
MKESEQPESSTSYTDVVKSRIRRLEPPTRLPGVDLARGAAVLGMFAAHLVVTTPLRWGSPATWTGMVDGRSSILFATLAGVSLGLSHPDSADRGGRRLATYRRRLAGRAAIIWALGIALVALAVPVNVILPAYGVLFAIAIALVAFSTRALVAIAAVLAVSMPFAVGAVNAVTGGGVDDESTSTLAVIVGWPYPFPLWAAFLAAGMAAGRSFVVSSRWVFGLVGIGTALAVIGYAGLGPVGNRAADALGDGAQGDVGLWLLSRLGDEPHSSGMGEAIGSGGFALAVIGVCVLVGGTRLRWLFWPVRVLGSMPLTAYTAHLVVWAVWIATHRDDGGELDPTTDFHALEPFWPMALGVMAGCVLWAVFVGRGPLETAVSRLAAGVTDREPPSSHGAPGT